MLLRPECALRSTREGETIDIVEEYKLEGTFGDPPAECRLDFGLKSGCSGLCWVENRNEASLPMLDRVVPALPLS